MKRLRVTLFSLLALFLLLVACLSFVNQWLLPQKVKPFLLKHVQETTGLVPEASSFSYHPWKGVVLSKVQLYALGQKEKPILQAETVSFRFLWIPFVWKRQILVSELSLKNPHLLLERDAQGRWNVGQFLGKGGKTPTPLVSHISIAGGVVEVVDETVGSRSSMTFAPLDLQLAFALPDHLRFKGRFGLSGLPTMVAVNGTYSLPQREFSFHLEIQQVNERLLRPYLGALPLTVSELNGTLRCDVSVDRNQTVSLQKLHYEGALSLQQEKWKASGQGVLEGFYTLWPKEPPEVDYFFTFLIKEGRFESKLLPSPVEQLEGKLSLKERTLTLENLKGRWAGQQVTANGSLQNIQEPVVDLDIQSILDLPSLQMVPWMGPLLAYGRILSGQGTLHLTLRGPIGKETPMDYVAEGRLENASVKLDLLPQPAESVGGTFILRPDQLVLKQIEGTYDKKPFQLEASLNDFRNPSVAVNLSHDGQMIQSEFKVIGENFQPFKIHLRRGPGELSFEGAVSHYRKPSLDGEVAFKGFLQNLTSLFPKFQEPMKRLNLQKFFLKDLRSLLRYANQTLVLSDIDAHAYGGTLRGNVSFGFSEPSPFVVQLETQGLRLEGILPTFSPRLRKIQGRLDGTLHLEGNADDPKATVGQGTLSIREGNLYEAPILRSLFGVWQPILSLLYPQLDEWVTLKEAKAQFFIANDAIQTQDLQIIGDRLTLYGTGKVGFDQSLDGRFLIRFTDPEILERRSDLSRLKNILIDETGTLGGEVRVKGTLSEPKCHYSALPGKRIRHFLKGAAELLLPGISGEE